MARPDDPMLAGIEDDMADLSIIKATFRDLAQYWRDLDPDAALAILEQGYAATRRISTRTRQRHDAFSRQYHPK